MYVFFLLFLEPYRKTTETRNEKSHTFLVFVIIMSLSFVFSFMISMFLFFGTILQIRIRDARMTARDRTAHGGACVHQPNPAAAADIVVAAVCSAFLVVGGAVAAGGCC